MANGFPVIEVKGFVAAFHFKREAARRFPLVGISRYAAFISADGYGIAMGGLLIGHVLYFRHNAFKDRAMDNKAVAVRPARRGFSLSVLS